MYVYKFKVDHFDPTQDQVVFTSYGIVTDNTYSEAIKQIEECFDGCDINEIIIDVASDYQDNSCIFLEKEDWDSIDL